MFFLTDVMITDQYGNQVQTVTSACIGYLGVAGPGLDKSNLQITWQVNKILRDLCLYGLCVVISLNSCC